MSNIDYAERLRALPSPSHALRAYIGSLESINQLNAEDITAEGWYERWLNVNALHDRHWQALSDEDKQRARSVA